MLVIFTAIMAVAVSATVFVYSLLKAQTEMVRLCS